MLLFYHEVVTLAEDSDRLCLHLVWLLLIDSGICMQLPKYYYGALFYRGTIPDNLKKYIHGEHSDLDKKQLLALGSKLVLILTSALKVLVIPFFRYCLTSVKFDAIVPRTVVLMEER